MEETKLIEATMFQSHAALRRVMEEEHLVAAALQLTVPEKLASLQASGIQLLDQRTSSRGSCCRNCRLGTAGRRNS